MKNLTKKYYSVIKELEIATGKDILKRLENEKDKINQLSKISEIRFGEILLKEFRDFLKYEPNILGKSPDWLIETKGEKIIFEVLKINPQQCILQKEIYNYENNTQPLSGAIISHGISKDYPKILSKEVAYRELIEKEKYKLIICIDASSLTKMIDINDIKDFFNFKNKYAPISKHTKFVKNVAGLIAIPLWEIQSL